MQILNESKKIGIILTLTGLAFMCLGVVMLGDKALLALGNVLFVAGVFLIIGLHRSIKFFFRMTKAKGTIMFFGGLFIVLIGWPLFGILIEFVGVFFLFGSFLPAIINFLQNVPICGQILKISFIKNSLDSALGKTLPMTYG